MTRKIADFLRCLNINAVALHGDTDQKGRMKVIDKFRKTCAQLQEQKLSKIENDREAGFEERELQARGVSSSHASTSYRSVNTPMKKYGCVLVCTDIVARGLDIPNLDLVVHYHVPFDSETYIHRCGRTARGTNFGKTVVLVSPQEDQQWRIIQHTLHVGIGKDQDIGRAVTSELDKTMKANKTSHSDHYNRGASPSNVSDVKKITFNSKYLVHIRDRLRYAHHIAESGVAEKANRKEQDYENKIFDALGFERDEFWYLTKKEKNRKQNEEGGLIAYEVNKDKHSLKRARFELNGLLRKNIWTQGGTFDW
jgi:superfamily II DNA/RNA helicase